MSSTDTHAVSRAAEIRTMLKDGQTVEPELQEIFCEEAEDHLRVIYDGLDRLQVNAADGVALADVRRASHTLKGAAGAVGVDPVTRLCHRMEDLLDDLAENGRPVRPEITLLLLSTADRMQELAGQSFDFETMAEAIDGLYQQYQTLLPTAGQTPTQQPTESQDAFAMDCEKEFDEEFDQDDTELAAALAAFGVEIDEVDPYETTSDASGRVSGTVSVPTSVANAIESESTTGDRSDNSIVAHGTNAEPHLRVPLSRLDEMVRLVGEMIIQRSAFAQRLGDFTSQIEELEVAVGRLRNASEEVETHCSNEAFRKRDRDSLGMISHRFSPANRWAALTNSPINGNQEFDELEFDRYNDFHLLARILSEATSDVASISRECRVLSGDFDGLMRRWQRLTRDAQDRLTRIRMVPLRNVVPRLGRAIRSIASQGGKTVQFVVRGDHTELDKTVLEEIADPLLHLVRNAVDHGIEMPEQRVAAGKPAEATLSIEVVNQGTQITLRVEDDGRGLDVDRIRNLAIERGLIEPDQQLSTDEIHRLIFLPGFSTADSVTDVSGRGVGMDVVREAIQRLKGIIRLDSNAGNGVRFTIILPTTLAVTRAVMVRCGGSPFAIPMQAVSKISRLDPKRVQRCGDEPELEIDGRTIRLRTLAELLGIDTDSDLDSARPMLVIESGDRRMAILVDEVEGGQDIVVKSLGDHLRCVRGVIGATIHGDGSVIPILDPADLVELCRDMPAAIGIGATATGRLAHLDSKRNVLIVDDSVSVRRITAGVMRNGGWSVTTAKDGVDALEQLFVGVQPPDVILLDMEMPRMDGLELLSHLRSDDAYARTPIVMVTSRAGEKHRNRAMIAGATEYVVKPFRDDQLLSIAAKLADERLETD